MKCRWCERENEAPCFTVADMADMAVAGDDECFAVLKRIDPKQEQEILDLRSLNESNANAVPDITPDS